MTAYQIAPVTADEATAFVEAVARGFGKIDDPEFVRETVEVEVGDPTLSLAARDRKHIIGTATVLDFAMAVPFADPVPCAGVTSVTTSPTHRRRGVLRALMRHQLDDVRARGWHWAALYASESAIYGRYGYGVAAGGLRGTIDRAWTRLHPAAGPAAVELVEAEEAVTRIPPIYSRVAASVPGMMTVSERYWRHRVVWDPAGQRGGASARFVALIADRAYALYRMKMGWDASGPDGTLVVEECVATDADAERQIWSYLFGVDLAQHVRIERLPVDHPLPWWLVERQRLQLTPSMPLYLRLVDVERAMGDRGTRADDAVVLDVTDEFCPWNARRWRVEGDGAALHCAPADGPVDVRLDARELASLSLGGVTPQQLARAELIEQHTPGALDRLGALLASDRPPFNAFIF